MFEASVATRANFEHPEDNQDAYFADDTLRVYGVFDGVGGAHGGSFASQACVEYLKQHLSRLNQVDVLTAHAGMRQLLLDMNTYVEARKRESGDRMLEKAGSTASLVKIIEQDGNRKAVVGTVGDSRVYIRGRNGEMKFVSEDHSLLHAWKKLGRISSEQYKAFSELLQSLSTQEELKAHPEVAYFYENRNAISQSIAGKDGIDPDVQLIPLEEGDEIIVTSDGVHDNLTQKEIENILLGEGTATEVTARLMESAYTRSRGTDFRSKPDDITVVAMLSKNRGTQQASSAPFKKQAS